MSIEDLLVDDSGMLLECIGVGLCVIVDSSLLLTKTTMLLPVHVVVVEVLQKHYGPRRCLRQNHPYKSFASHVSQGLPLTLCQPTP